MQLYAFTSLFGGVIRAIVLTVLVLYLLFVFCMVRLAVKGATTRRSKIIAGLVTFSLVFGLPVGWLVFNIVQNQRQARIAYANRDAAYARYEELCKSAGEFIHRRAEDVDGVFLMKLRLSGVYPDDRWTKERESKKNDGSKWNEDQFGWWFDNERRYGFRSGAYIVTFLESYWGTPYAYVDAVDPEDGKRYRYTGRSVPVKGSDREEFQMERAEVTPDMPLPRYGVTFADITEREDRERWWIAGSSLKVIDLETNEVMGERVGHMMVSWLGGHSLAESYGWLTSQSMCPYDSKDQGRSGSEGDRMHGTAAFIRKVGRPNGAEPEPEKPGAEAATGGRCPDAGEKN